MYIPLDEWQKIGLFYFYQGQNDWLRFQCCSGGEHGEREEGGKGTCYNAAVVANGNEQDDDDVDRKDGCLCLRPKRGNAPSSQHSEVEFLMIGLSLYDGTV